MSSVPEQSSDKLSSNNSNNSNDSTMTMSSTGSSARQAIEEADIAMPTFNGDIFHVRESLRVLPVQPMLGPMPDHMLPAMGGDNLEPLDSSPAIDPDSDVDTGRTVRFDISMITPPSSVSSSDKPRIVLRLPPPPQHHTGPRGDNWLDRKCAEALDDVQHHLKKIRSGLASYRKLNLLKRRMSHRKRRYIRKTVLAAAVEKTSRFTLHLPPPPPPVPHIILRLPPKPE